MEVWQRRDAPKKVQKGHGSPVATGRTTKVYGHYAKYHKVQEVHGKPVATGRTGEVHGRTMKLFGGSRGLASQQGGPPAPCKAPQGFMKVHGC